MSNLGQAGRAKMLAVLALAALFIALQANAPLTNHAARANAANASNEVNAAQPSEPRSEPDRKVLRAYPRTRAERDNLVMEFGLEHVHETSPHLTLWTDDASYRSLLARGLRVEVDTVLTGRANALHADDNDPSTFYGGYLTVEEMEAFLDRYVVRTPLLAQKVDIGDSWCKLYPGACTLPEPYPGYDIWALRITNRALPGSKPVFWFDAGIHAREIATPEMAMRFITWLLDGYETNADARWIVDHHEVWVVPMFNPDGHHIVESGGGGEAPYLQRKTADNDDGCSIWPPSGSAHFGVDLNRNFPLRWGCCGTSSPDPCAQTYRGTEPGSGEEGQAVRAKVRELIPDQRGELDTDAAPITTTGLYQNMHSNGAIHLYPSRFNPNPVPNADDMLNMANHMGAPEVGGSGYPTCQPPGCYSVIEGAAIMWAYGELGVPSFLTEISGDWFFPDYSYLDTIWNENREGLIYSAKIARMPYLTTRGPDAQAVGVEPEVVNPGATAHLTATINYAWSNNIYYQNVAAAEYYIDTPPWAGGTPHPMQASDGVFNSPIERVEANIDTTALPPGRHLIFVRGRGVNSYEGFQSWGPVSAQFLDVVSEPLTPTPVPSHTGTPTSTATANPTQTIAPPPTGTTPSSPTAVATSTVAVCTVQFDDVPPDHTFYEPVRCLACRGIVSGYADGTFRPGNEVTRGQLSKIVSNAAGFENDPGPQIFTDVAPANTFYTWINRLARRGIMSGYGCGGPGEPCDSENRPYFRWVANATRGQTSKIVANAAKIIGPPTGRQFEDVPPSHPFYEWIEKLAALGVMGGYPCGGLNEPCVPPNNRPYFRPANNVTRGQSARIVANTFYPDCTAPERR
jgi:carboxypeptidase T